MQLLAEFLKEQNQKQAQLKRKRTGDQRVETSEMSVQCHISTRSCSTADASVQTDHNDLMTELRQQILNLTDVVKQLTALKCLHHYEPTPAALPLFNKDSDFPTLDSEAVASLGCFVAALGSRVLRKKPQKTCRPCLHPKWLYQEHPCTLLIKTFH